MSNRFHVPDRWTSVARRLPGGGLAYDRVYQPRFRAPHPVASIEPLLRELTLRELQMLDEAAFACCARIEWRADAV